MCLRHRLIFLTHTELKNWKCDVLSHFVTVCHKFTDSRNFPLECCKLHTKERFLVNWSRFRRCVLAFSCVSSRLSVRRSYSWLKLRSAVEVRKLLLWKRKLGAKVRRLMFFTSIFQWFISRGKIRQLIPYFSPASVRRHARPSASNFW